MPRTPARPSQKPKSYSQRLRRNDNVSHSSSMNKNKTNRPNTRPPGPRNTGLPSGYVNRICQRRSLSSTSSSSAATAAKTRSVIPLAWPLGSVTYASVAARDLDTTTNTSGHSSSWDDGAPVLQQHSTATPPATTGPPPTPAQQKTETPSLPPSLPPAPPPSPACSPKRTKKNAPCFLPHPSSQGGGSSRRRGFSRWLGECL